MPSGQSFLQGPFQELRKSGQWRSFPNLKQPPRGGIYGGGGVGYYSWNGGDADFAIVIRTLLIQGGKKVSLQSGGAGIVADSDPAYEFRETERKMAAMLTAIGGETEL